MALKDWNHTQTYKDENNHEEIIYYVNQKNGVNIHIGTSSVKLGKWFVTIDYGAEKYFDTKSMALNHAKAYMEKH